jgi:hypothetical protein
MSLLGRKNTDTSEKISIIENTKEEEVLNINNADATADATADVNADATADVFSLNNVLVDSET